MTRTRRDVLTGVGTILSVALAGCRADETEPRRSLGSTPRTTTSGTTTTATRTTPISPDPGWVKLNLVPTKSEGIVERAVRTRSSFDPEEQRFLDRLASEGSVTVHDVTRHSELPLHPPYLVELEGSVYLVDERTTASQEVEVRRFRIEVSDASREDARAFDDLSELDQAIVKRGLTEEYRENGTPFAGTFFYEFGKRSPGNSRLVTNDGDFLVDYEDDILRLRSRGSDTVVEQDVRYALTRVAPNRSAAREYVVREYVHNISTGDVPTAQREILTAAANDPEGYKREGQGPESFQALLDHLDDTPQVPNDGRYVRYNGTIYQVAHTGVET